MNNTYKALLLGFLGIAIAVVSIVYIAKPNWDTKKMIESENATLQARLTELQAKQAKRDLYLAETEEYQEKFDEMLNAFPADLNQEVSIMFVKSVRDDYEIDVSSLGLGQKEQFYTLGTGGMDAALAADPAAAPATTDPAATDPTALSADATSSAYNCYRAAFPISYEGAYSSIKDVVSFINTYTDRMTIDSISIAYNAEMDSYSGNMNMMCYSIEGEDRPERVLELNEVEKGVGNIFTGGSSEGGSTSNGLNKYDENDGAAIESNYDFYAMLNAATSDVSAKVIGQNGSGKEASVISNSDNTVSTLTFDFYEKDGKNYCKYTLDGATSYEAEVTSAEDIKLLLQSSARKNDDDKVGIRVTINNSTSLPVYVKVSGDDVNSARVNIASKTGSVKVYK